MIRLNRHDQSKLTFGMRSIFRGDHLVSNKKRSHSLGVCDRSEILSGRLKLSVNENGRVLRKVIRMTRTDRSNGPASRGQIFAEAASCIVHCIGTPADHLPTMLRGDRAIPELRHLLDNGTCEHSEKWSLDRVSCVSVHLQVSGHAHRLRTVSSEPRGIRCGIAGEFVYSDFHPDTQTHTRYPDTGSHRREPRDTVSDRNTESSKVEHASCANRGWNSRGETDTLANPTLIACGVL